MHFSLKKMVLRPLKITGIIIGSLLLLMFLIPYLFPQAVNRKIDQWANENINGNISFSGTGLSFFKKFPALTLTMYNVTVKGSAPFDQDTLIAAKEISLGIDLSSVLKSKITINKVFLSNAFINIQADSAGHANYNIYKQHAQTTTNATDTSGASLGINKIIVENSRLIYNDQSIPITINARGFNYTGSGDLSKDIFLLNTHTDIQSLDLYYGHVPYILSKKINADLITEVNTRSLAFVFQKNDLYINQLPVAFNGSFGFLKDGYDMDFHIDSKENDLDEIVSALPADYQKLLDKTDINGTGDVQIALTGKYVVKDSLMPDLVMNVKVRNGYVDNDRSPAPVRNLYVDMNARLPHLNMDSLAVNVDSLYFNLGNGYFNSSFKLKGVSNPYIFARVNSEIDLEKWDRALGLKPFHMKGIYSLHLLADGVYAKSIVHSGLRKTDTIISSIPKFSLRSSFRKGYLKYTALPEAVNDISFNLTAGCPDHDYKHATLSIDSLHATALNNYIKGYCRVENMANFPVDALLQAHIHLADIKQFIPLPKGFALAGDLDAHVQAKGKYVPAKKQYPVLLAGIQLKDGSVQTKYYPHPIEQIQVSSTISDQTGSLKGLNVSIKPISFTFEEEPFLLKAELHDLTDLAYKVHMKGVLNLGNIYQVFAIKGYNVSGTIAADLHLKGKQSDIDAGRYDQLSNHGVFRMNNVSCTTELYPRPFLISHGSLSFDQDKIKLDTLAIRYGRSSFILNGAVSNVINYALKPGAGLKGNMNLSSDMLNVNDFMVFSDTSKAATTSTTATSPSGVVLIPGNLDLAFTANIKNVVYNDIVIKNAKGNMTISKDTLRLKETGFDIIGAPVSMDATYTAINTKNAHFDYHINAQDFDINKAYRNIKLFHDIVSSAQHAQGLVSLDYKLSGKLDEHMAPVYTSLKGGGTLSAKKIGMYGMKLFNAMGKAAGQDSLGGNSEVSKVAIKSTIANNLLTIERTKMRIAGFRVRFEGQVSFSKAIDMKMRIGLPPMGLIGIPLAITGTEDNPKIEMSKGKKEDELQATADDGETD
jgi:AsmA protein